MPLFTLTTLTQISQALEEVRNTHGRNAKLKLTRGWRTPAWVEFLDMVANPDRNFYVTWLSVCDFKGTQSMKPEQFEATFAAAEKRVDKRNVTCAKLKGLMKAGVPQNVIKAICDKTLDCGLSVELIYKTQGLKAVFTASLCADALAMTPKKLNDIIDAGNYVATPKMDGLRCFIILAKDKAYAVSKNMKPLKNMQKMCDRLARAFKGRPCVLDGEILSRDWNNTMTAVTKEGADEKKVYHAFDCIPYDEFISQEFAMPYSLRYQTLSALLPKEPEFMLVSHSAQIINGLDAKEEAQKAIAKGFEGVVLHNLDIPYTPGRHNGWIKVKCFLSGEFKITAFHQGRGKYSNTLGSVTVKGIGPKLKNIVANVSGGFSDAQRNEIWKNQSAFKGRVIEVEYQEITKDNSLRFPKVIRFRTDVEKGL